MTEPPQKSLMERAYDAGYAEGINLASDVLFRTAKTIAASDSAHSEKRAIVKVLSEIHTQLNEAINAKNSRNQSSE